jgi:hypothetical protein
MKTEEQKKIDELKEEIEHLKRSQVICARDCMVQRRVNEIVGERDRISDYVKRLIEPLRGYANGLPICDDLEALIRESGSFTHFSEGRRFYTNDKAETIIRDQFDVFANKRGLRIDRDEDEIYVDLLTHKCWLTWKAALHSIDSEL